MGAVTLDNVTAGDAYSEATTLHLLGAVEAFLQVANGGIRYQVDESPGATGNWGPERYLAPLVGVRPFKCSGIRFRAAAPGVTPRPQVTCELRDANELVGGSLSSFDTFVAPNGSTGSTLTLQTGDIYWTARATPRDGTLACDGAHYNAVADPTLENLWNEIGIVFGGTGKADFAVPDLRDRVAVGAGGNTARAANDGVAAANRHGTRHRHTPHTHSTPTNAANSATPNFNANYTPVASPGITGASDGGSGVAADPLDGPAFLGLNAYIVK